MFAIIDSKAYYCDGSNKVYPTEIAGGELLISTTPADIKLTGAERMATPDMIRKIYGVSAVKQMPTQTKKATAKKTVKKTNEVL